jgi:hypothetical protein
MRGAGVAAGLAIGLAAQAHAKPAPRSPSHLSPPPAHIESRPAAPLPMLPSVARVRIEAARDRVVVVEEVNLPRGDWRSGGLDLYVAFGAPGVPVAIDARLVAVPRDALESRPEEPGDPLTVEPSFRRFASAQLLLGRPQMAGVVVHVKDLDLRRGYAASDLLALRIRSLLSPPAADSRGVRDIVVRLGIAGDLPLTLGRIQFVSLEGKDWITRAEATLCGPDADGLPLALTTIPRLDRAAASPVDGGAVASDDAGGEARVAPIAPVMAVRHASDDLCLRWWAAP